jgi:hypothetical protein
MSVREITFQSSFDEGDDFVEESFAFDDEEQEMDLAPRTRKGCQICGSKSCRRDCFDLD